MDLARSYLENTQIRMTTGGLTRVTPDWNRENQINGENILYLFLEGEGALQIGHVAYHPVPGDLFLIPAGTRLSRFTSGAHPFFKYWCHFHATVGDIPLFDLLDAPNYIALNKNETFRQQFHQLIGHYESDALSAPMLVKSILYFFIAKFVERAALNPLQTATIPSVHKLYIVLQYIDKHLTKPISVDELAKLVNFHPKYFLQYFKSMLGVSPIVFINKKRMQKAQSMLLHTEETVAEIAEQLGIQPPYLSRMFKKFTGFSPNEFRQQQRRHPR